MKKIISIGFLALAIVGCQSMPVKKIDTKKDSNRWEIVKSRGDDNSECGRYTFALDKSGKLWGWGDKRNSVFGFFVNRTNSTTPSIIADNISWEKVVMGCYGAFGVAKNGKLYGWGENSGINSGKISPTAPAGSRLNLVEITGAHKGVILNKINSLSGKLLASDIDIE